MATASCLMCLADQLYSFVQHSPSLECLARDPLEAITLRPILLQATIVDSQDYTLDKCIFSGIFRFAKAVKCRRLRTVILSQSIAEASKQLKQRLQTLRRCMDTAKAVSQASIQQAAAVSTAAWYLPLGLELPWAGNVKPWRAAGGCISSTSNRLYSTSLMPLQAWASG